MKREHPATVIWAQVMNGHAEMIVNFIVAIGEPIKKTLDWHGCDSVCHPKHNH